MVWITVACISLLYWKLVSICAYMYLLFYIFSDCCDVDWISGTQWNCRKWHIPVVVVSVKTCDCWMYLEFLPQWKYDDQSYHSSNWYETEPHESETVQCSILILTQRNSQPHGQEKTKLCLIKYCSLKLCGVVDLHLLAASFPSCFTPSKEPWCKLDRKKMGCRTCLNIVLLGKISALPGSEPRSSSSIANWAASPACFHDQSNFNKQNFQHMHIITWRTQNF